MSDQLKPNQALFLWRMIVGESLDVQQPAKSKAKPDIGKDRKKLLDEGYLSTEKRGKAEHLILTDKAWQWAASNSKVHLLKSRSTVGAEALEGLLRRLLPFLQAQEIPLAALFMDSAANTASAKDSPSVSTTSAFKDSDALRRSVEQAYLSLSNGRRKERVLLRDLRGRLPQIARPDLDRLLIDMQRQRRLVLYREDNTAALTPADSEGALIIGDSPRHIVYLED